MKRDMKEFIRVYYFESEMNELTIPLRYFWRLLVTRFGWKRMKLEFTVVTWEEKIPDRVLDP